MIIKWLTGLIKGKKRREKAKVEIEELKKALLEDPKFRDEILRELEYRTGRRDLLKAGVLGLLGFTVGTVVGSEGVKATTQPVSSNPVNSNVARDIVSDYAVKIPKPCTCIVAQDGTGDYDVSPGEDASEVIQRAIDYTHEKGGGEVRIKEGEYKIGKTIIVSSNIFLKGCNVGSTIFVAKAGLNSDIIRNRYYSGGGYDSNIMFQNLLISGNGANQKLRSIPISIANLDGIYINNVKVFYGNSYCIHSNKNTCHAYIINTIGNQTEYDPIFAGQWRDSIFLNCYAYYSASTGFNLWNSKNCRIAFCEAKYNTRSGIKIENDSTDIIISDCILEKNLEHGIFLTGYSNNIIINNCVSYRNKLNGIQIRDYVHYVQIIGGIYRDNHKGIEIWSDAHAVKDINICNCMCIGNPKQEYGIFITKCKNIMVSGCYLDGNSKGNLKIDRYTSNIKIIE